MNMGNPRENIERSCRVEYQKDSSGMQIFLDGDMECGHALMILVQAVSMIQYNMCYDLMLLTRGCVTRGCVKEIPMYMHRFISDLPAVFVDADGFLDQSYDFCGFKGYVGGDVIANMEKNGMLRTHEGDGYKYVRYAEWDTGGGACAKIDPGRMPSFKERISQIMRSYDNCGKLEGIVRTGLDWLDSECDKPVVPEDPTK